MKGTALEKTTLVLIPLVAFALVSNAEVLVERTNEPLVESVLRARGESPPVGGLVAPPAKSNVPAEGQWFIPHYRADKLQVGDSTYFAVRSEGALPSTALAEFFDVRSVLQTTESYDLQPREVKTVAIKLVPNLPIDGDGYTRGFLRISSLVPVSVDYFQLETRNAFAVGGVGFVIDDFCTRWNSRFLRFDPSGGTTLSMMINGPRGALSSDPVTVAGDVYTEGGAYVGSFGIRTDEWSVVLPIHNLMPSGLEFGVVELVINSTFSPAGIIEVQHQALDQFSVGHWAICMD
jgi:hypothetical protein